MISPGGPAISTGTAAPEPVQPPRRVRRRRGYWVPGLIATAVLLAIGLALGAGDLDHRSPSTLAGPEVAQNIALGVQAQEGSQALDVHCPASEPVRVGRQFDCTLTQAGRTRSIHVVEIDGRGHLRWTLGA